MAYDFVYGFRDSAHELHRGVDLPWEWTVARPIRSTVFPGIYAAVFKLAQVLGLDRNSVLVSVFAMTLW